jgi:hypothetical protein
MKKLFLFLTLTAVFSCTEIFAQAPAAPQQDMTVDAATKTQTIDAVLSELNKRYVFPEVAKQMETDVRSRAAKKEYDNITSARDFANKLTEDLQSVSRDKHLRVGYSYEPIPVRGQTGEPTAEERAGFTSSMRRINYRFEKVERLQGNIGYVDLRGFFDPEGGAETVRAAMNFVANTDALIFDLRQNGGGDPSMVALISSYLFGDQPVHLNDLYWREGDRTDEFWTKPALADKKFADKDIYVLTSSRTFSGAEEFSNNLKALKRAVIIGETTGGGANPGSAFRLTEHFRAFVPTGRAINPITKTNWEGTGVEPDVKVPKELALKTAYLMALNKALEKTTDANLKGAYKGLIEQTQKELEMIKSRVKTD